MSMESSYGVGVQNRFLLPDEDDEVEVEDPQDILLNIEKKGDVKKEAPAKKPAAKGQQAKGKQGEKAANKPSKPAFGGDRASKPRGERTDVDRRPQSGRQASADGFGSETRAERGDRGRGRGRGGRGTGRGRGGRREFDRRSGSDRSSVKAQDKREGSGAHNWGNAMDDVNAEDRPAEEQQAEEGKENTPAEGAAAEGAEEPVEVEEEEKTMTLDEYKAQQQSRRYKSDVKVRKAGENEDQSKWKDTRVLTKGPAEEEDDDEYVYERKEQRATTKQTFDVNVRFSEPARRGGAGRGEGRGRGGGGRGVGRGRGGGRGNFGGDSRGNFGGDSRGRGTGTPNFSSEVDFPALGGK